MSNINVVIADDNERIRQNLQEIVSRECDMTLVGSASDGMDALSMIRTSHPDVVLLDIIMPKMDGLGVLEEVKKSEGNIILFIDLKKTGIYYFDSNGTGRSYGRGFGIRGKLCITQAF